MTDTRSGEKVSNNDSTERKSFPARQTRSATKSASPRLITYTPDELAALREAELSSQWPIFLDEAFKNDRGHWDPDRWHQNRKRGSTPPPDDKAKIATDRPTSSLSADGGKRRDPKERIKAEQADGGIVLSPQRRSFLTGCQGNSNNGIGQPNQLQPAPPGGNKKEEISLRPDTSRRVGSGRILNREREGGDVAERDRDRRFDRREDRFENRGFRRSESGVEPEDPRQRRPEPNDDPRQLNDDPRQRRMERGSGRIDPGENQGFNRQRPEVNEDLRRSRNSGSEQHWYGRREDDYSAGSRRGTGDPRLQRRDDFRRDDRRGGGGRYDSYRRSENEEPEWMSATVDQNELMELRGFDDSPEKEATPVPAKTQNSNVNDLDRIFRETGEKSGEATNDDHHETDSMVRMNRPPSGEKFDQGFNIDDILQFDVIPGLASILDDETSNTDCPSAEVPKSVPGSRFTQFFQRSSHPPEIKTEERRSSIQDELISVGGLFREISHGPPLQAQALPSVRIPSPGDPSAYFAPISPAAKTTNEPPSNNSILNMLRSNASGDAPTELRAAPSIAELRGQKVQSVEELEADIKHLIGVRVSAEDDQNQFSHHHHHHHHQQHQQQQQQHHRQQQQRMMQEQKQQQTKKSEMSAFEKFAAMVANVESNPPLQNLLQIDNPMLPGMDGPQRTPVLVRPSPLPPNAPTEQEILAGMIGPLPTAHPATNLGARAPPNVVNQPSSTSELLSAIYHAPFNANALKRPEALALQNALVAGHVNLDVLLEHFAHGTMPNLQREILLNVLKVAQTQGHLGPVPSPQVRLPPGRGGGPSPLPDTLAVIQQQTQRLSPGLIGGLTVVSPTPNQRIPSPQELVLHTQQIMQNALIKRKLEEQVIKEKFRRRQEGPSSDNGGCSGNSKVRATDSPLIFTPTAVMKKIAADRRDSDPTVAKVPVPELKIIQSSEKDNNDGSLQGGANQTAFSRSSPLPPILNLIPPGSGMLPPPPSTASRQQAGPSQLIALQQQQQQLRYQAQLAMQQQIAALHQATSPTTLLEHQQRLLMFQQHQQHAGLMQTMPPMNYASRPGAGNFQNHVRPPLLPQQAQQQQQPPVADLLRFFSPEVLAQAQAGSGPPMPPLPTKKALTLEEIEHQAAAAVRI